MKRCVRGPLTGRFAGRAPTFIFIKWNVARHQSKQALYELTLMSRHQNKTDPTALSGPNVTSREGAIRLCSQHQITRTSSVFRDALQVSFGKFAIRMTLSESRFRLLADVRTIDDGDICKCSHLLQFVDRCVCQ